MITKITCIIFSIITINFSSMTFAKENSNYDLYKIDVEKENSNHKRENEIFYQQYKLAKDKISSEYSQSKDRLSMIYNENLHLLEREFKENYFNKLENEITNIKFNIESDYETKKANIEMRYNNLSKEQKTDRRDSYKKEKNKLYEQRKISKDSIYNINKELKSYYYDLHKIAKNELNKNHEKMKEELKAQEAISLSKLENSYARLIAYSYNQFSPKLIDLRKRISDSTLLSFKNNKTNKIINEKRAEQPYNTTSLSQAMDINLVQEIESSTTKFDSIINNFFIRNKNEIN